MYCLVAITIMVALMFVDLPVVDSHHGSVVFVTHVRAKQHVECSVLPGDSVDLAGVHLATGKVAETTRSVRSPHSPLENETKGHLKVLPGMLQPSWKKT